MKTKTVSTSVLVTSSLHNTLEEKSAFWLLDAIVSWQFSPELEAETQADERLEHMQFWTLARRNAWGDPGDNSAVLYMKADSDAPIAVKQEIEYTDFPDKEINIWGCWNGEGWTFMLPEDY